MKHHPVVEYILRHGKRYAPADIPSSLKMGELGACFDNSVLNAARANLTYVEGLARNPLKPSEWFLHGWVSDGVHAYDVTWYMSDEATGTTYPVDTDYIGVAMPLDQVIEFMKATEHCGVFGSAWRDPELALACAPGIPCGRIKNSFKIQDL